MTRAGSLRTGDRGRLDRIAGMASFFSDLDLTGDTPVRVRPRLGEWGPALVPTTSRKKRVRILTVAALTVGLAAVSALMALFYKILQGG
ncbi:Hypothetical protein PROPJV5_0179 [Propionibacterium ruminifibrarum]|uniref:Uncharacterized protein n=2 Tax=Propionibacterium ruminifibrarum TaxID=1962131 RepID=A0A375HZK1_9ACTN|nr:Hypothetical protein PROPJV5_0179 [Propionibacterium ruminifibrarum]